MRYILTLILIGILVNPVYARPDGGITDGSRINIQDFGFSIVPISGMRIQLAGKSEPENYRFPWFMGKVGIINFALVGNSDPKRSLEQAFEAHVKKLESRTVGIKYIGKFEHVTLKSGIEALRAEFRGKGDSVIIRYYMHDSNRRVCFAHLMPISSKDKAIEAVIRDTMKVAKQDDDQVLIPIPAKNVRRALTKEEVEALGIVRRKGTARVEDAQQ